MKARPAALVSGEAHLPKSIDKGFCMRQGMQELDWKCVGPNTTRPAASAPGVAHLPMSMAGCIS